MTDQTQADREVGAETVLAAIRHEYTRARLKHAPLHSGHEAVGVIDEEFTEFKEAVYFAFDRRGRRTDPAREAIQIAAMALAYVVEAYQTWEFHDAALGEEGPITDAKTPADPLIPPWEMCKTCGGDHWTKDHPE